ncbi:MAG: universal stress protein [Candidatus Korobacteraceae bacterium]|jgi:nucleotide-binding universal stress UspA family protein
MPLNIETPYFRKILVGYDGSPLAEKAVDLAIRFGICQKSAVSVLAVARLPEPATSVELEAVLDDAREHFEIGLKRVVERGQAHGVEIGTDIVVGHPGEQIIHRAETEQVDLIIVGRRGTSLFQKMMLGSVSERVLRYAHCPVLLVK